jgi:hypothetical protein
MPSSAAATIVAVQVGQAASTPPSTAVATAPAA